MTTNHILDEEPRNFRGASIRDRFCLNPARQIFRKHNHIAISAPGLTERPNDIHRNFFERFVYPYWFHSSGRSLLMGLHPLATYTGSYVFLDVLSHVPPKVSIFHPIPSFLHSKMACASVIVWLG